MLAEHAGQAERSKRKRIVKGNWCIAQLLVQGIQRQFGFGDTVTIVWQRHMDLLSQFCQTGQDFLAAPVLGQEQIVLPQPLLEVAGGFVTKWIAVDI